MFNIIKVLITTYAILKIRNCQYINQNVNRLIDATTNIVIEQLDIQISSKTPSDTSAPYILPIPKALQPNLAFYEAFHGNNKLKIKNDLSAQTPQLSIDLNAPQIDSLPAQIRILLAYTHLAQPSPKKAFLKSKKRMKVVFPAYFASLYDTTQQKTTFKATKKRQGEKIQNADGPQPFKISRNKLSVVFGPYPPQPPNSPGNCSVKFGAQTLYKTARSVKKTVTVSHWGRVFVKEAYLVENTGPALKGEFSTIEADRFSGVISGFNAKLPFEAEDFSVRDVVGKIYNFEATKNEELGVTVLKVPLRFPLAGSWQAPFDVEYSLPGAECLAKKGSRFKLEIESFVMFKGLVVDDYSLHIILPEGVKNWEIEGLEAKNLGAIISGEKHFNFLDSIGSQKIKISAKNLVSFHEHPFTVSYDYNTLFLLLKPAIIFLYISLALLAYLVASRLKRISGSETKKSAVKKGPSKVHADLRQLKKDAPNMSRKNLIKAIDSLITQIPTAGEGKQRVSLKRSLSSARQQSSKKMILGSLVAIKDW